MSLEQRQKKFVLAPDFQSFYMGRLEKALHRLFHPPPDGMPDAVYITERSDISAQVRAILASGVSSLRGLADSCVHLERMESEVRELDQKLRQLTQDTAALARGGELHAQRGQLTERQAKIRERKENLIAEVTRLEGELSELKREEKNFEEIAKKAEKGQNLALLAARYRQVAGEIKVRAADVLRRKISEHVGDLWVEITERDREFSGMEFRPALELLPFATGRQARVLGRVEHICRAEASTPAGLL